MFFLCRNHFHRHSSPSHRIHGTSMITLSTWFHGFHGFLTGHLLLSTYHKYLHVFIYQLIKLIQQISLRGTYFSPSIASIARKNSVSLILLIKNLCSFCSYVKKLIKIRADTRDTWRHITLDIRTKEHNFCPFCSSVKRLISWPHKTISMFVRLKYPNKTHKHTYCFP